MVKFWVKSMGVVFQQAPALPFVAGVKVTADPGPATALPTRVQEGQTWACAAGVRPRTKRKKAAGNIGTQVRDKSVNMALRAFKRGTQLQRADKKVAIK
jgi:hypothetical protein